VEAMLTHAVSMIFDVPSAHAPMMESMEILDLESLTKPCFEGIETKNNTPNCQEGFMNIVATFIPYFQSPELVQPSQRAFHHPAIYPQAAAVFGSPFGQYRAYTHLSQSLAMWLGVIPAITMKILKAISGTTRLAGNGRNGVDQR